MRIACSYRGKQSIKQTSKADFMFGRAEERFPIGLDLTPDQKVSRVHGRIWFEKDVWWIEDHNSSRGTRLNDIEIKGQGKQRLRLHDVVTAGQTALSIESFELVAPVAQTNYLEMGTALLPNVDTAGPQVAIAQDLDATNLSVVPLQGTDDENSRRLKVIC